MKIYGADIHEIVKAFKSGEIRIAVYGLGRMGLPLATVFADHGATVIGVDVNLDAVSTINRGNCHIVGERGLAELVEKNVIAGRLSATSNLVDAAKQTDVMVIVVPTVLDSNHNPDLSNLKSVCGQIAKGLDEGDVIIQESTVPLRTTSEVTLPILENSGLKRGQFGLACCPEHARYGTVIRDIRGSHLKVVGGIDSASTQAAAGIYSAINSRGVISVSDSTTAEAVKTFAGTYKDVNIALANEFAMVCSELGISAIEVFDALNRPPPYAHLFVPGCGVGGHCIPQCGYQIASAVKTDTRLLKLAREINDGMADYTVDLLRRGLQEVGVDLRDTNVLVLGVTFRGDVKDMLNSPAILIIGILIEQCSRVYGYDPLLHDEVGQYGAIPISDLYEVKDNLQIDAVIIASDHAEFKTVDWDILGRRMRHKVLVDGRQCVDVSRMRVEGWIAYGIGA